ncbi:MULTISPECIES: type VI secretion protein [Paraburkholderia]|uniref:type VI secretion protein n=1 Tax=Paraburkholderia TaxID=1822464 RepID=UPI00224F2FC1|nr:MULTISPECIES: type VI secretion protein [Paraburkholderia]MCX4176667.1 type VI secretion protein [Paraburkholderia madseniana]MDQ6464658.1 type VI secretion protein [Paraburkholderia madseniana]
MPTLTYYSTSADLTTLYAILNAVAMICQQTVFIWAFALAVSLWRLLSTSVGAVFQSSGGAQAGISTLSTGGMSAFVPFVAAFVLTNPGLQGTVQIEATVNGALSEVDHVPFVISAIPAAGSVLSMNLNQYVSTAFGNVDAEYPVISSTANGFMNPMKILLSSRTAMYRLGGIDSEIKSVVSTCLGPDAGVNYAAIQNQVMNSGNSGATAAKSIAINGVNPTSIGALLYQAAQNTSGMVNDVSLSANNYLTCADAAQQVANDISTALTSVEFPRVLQGAVNGMDQPLANADFSFSTVAGQFNAISVANTLGSTFTGGTAQSEAEFMNMLFSEMVENDISCLRASGDSLTQCQSTALQASEVERNNLQEAASEVPMLRYAGSFGNYLIALIIGLGPVIVMFMMFAGIGAGKTIKNAAHIIVWPLLVVNVGAELVNGMICISYANFLNELRQGGWLSHAVTFAAYKELSLQIGTGSHIMASLPVLMSVIFGLGESSAMTNVGSSISPKSTEVAENLAPRPESTAPMFQQSQVAMGTQYGDGMGRLMYNGGIEAAASSVSYGNSAREVSQTLSQADQRSQSITQGEQDLRDFRRANSTGDFSRFTNDSVVATALARNWADEHRAGNDEHRGANTSDARANSNTSRIGATAHAGVGTDGVGWGVGGSTSTEAGTQDSATRTTSVGKNEALSESQAMASVLSKTMQQLANTSHGTQASSDLTKALDRQQSYQKTISQVQSTSDIAAQAVRDSDSFVDMAGSLHADQIVRQSQTNGEYRTFQMTEGRLAQQNPAFSKYLGLAEEEAKSGATDSIVSSPATQDMVNRHRAAYLLAHDSGASAADRKQGLEYLAKEGSAMFHGGVERDVPQPKNMHIDSPSNATGLPGFGPQGGVLPQSRAPQGGGVPPARPHVAHPGPAATPGGVLPQSRAPQGDGAPPARPNVAHPGPAATPVSAPQSDLGEDVRAKVEGGLTHGSAAMGNAIKGADRYAEYAGLTEEGPGTIRRTVNLVNNNAADLARKAGTASMTGMGDPNKPLPGQEPAPSPKPTPSKFVRR